MPVTPLLKPVEQMKVSELRLELAARGLQTGGLKAALVARLQQAMEPAAAPAEPTEPKEPATASGLDWFVAFRVIEQQSAEERTAFVPWDKLVVEPPNGHGDVVMANSLSRAALDKRVEHNFSVDLCLPTNYDSWGLEEDENKPLAVPSRNKDLADFVTRYTLFQESVPLYPLEQKSMLPVTRLSAAENSFVVRDHIQGFIESALDFASADQYLFFPTNPPAISVTMLVNRWTGHL